MGFWKTLFQVCSGTEIFLRLTDCRLGKALLHLLILILLLGVLLAWGHSCRTDPEIQTVCGRLFSEIGSLQFTPAGVRTGRNPDRKQHYLLDDRLRFDYYPGHSLAEADQKDWNTPYGLIAMDNGLIFWMENYLGSGKGSYMIVPLTLEQNPMKSEMIRTGLTGEKIFRFLKSRMEYQAGQKFHKLLPEVTGEQVSEYLKACFKLTIFFGSLFNMILLTGMSLLFFAALHYVFSFPSERRLSFRQILVVLTYASFPALLAGVLYSFFMIPLISPQTVFFIVYFIYDMIVFRKIRLVLNPPNVSPDDNDI